MDMNALLEACKKGDLKLVKELITFIYYDQKFISECVSVALSNRRINVFRYLTSRDMYISICGDSSKFLSYVMIKGVSNPN